MSAPYTGGYDPGATQFAVDGDFTSCDPCGPPKITFPFKGDSVFSSRDVLYLNADIGDYAPVALGTQPNIQPWSPNQAAFVIEQDFMVALEAYIPMQLNSAYYDGWAIGWTAVTSQGYPLPDLGQAVLVEEGQPVDMGQGIVKITRRFATIPPTRNDVEQYVYTFPGYNNGGDSSRLPFSRNVLSRLQFDYFIFDDLDVIPGVPRFPDGPRLDANTGLYPDELILDAQYYYAAVVGAVENNIFLPQGEEMVLTNPPDDSDPGTLPSTQDWLGWLNGDGTSDGNIPELIAEASTMRRWMGNIYERRTRYVLIQ